MLRPRILVADDEEEWRRLISFWLGEKGCDLRLVSSGAEVLPAALAFGPDCAVLDFDLGDRKATEVLDDLRRTPSLSSLPVVVLTSMAADVIKGRPKEAGVQIVAKSQNPDELLASLEGLLKEKGWRRDWDEPGSAGPRQAR